jgi:septal ring factor EnvC (AmiA/AmiB activator)
MTHAARLTFAALLTLGCAGALIEAADQPDLETKTRELERLKARIEALRVQLNSAASERERQNLALSEQEKQIGVIARQIRNTGQSLEAQRRRLSQLEQEREALDRQLHRHRQGLAGQLRSAYMMGRQERLKILLNQQDPAVVSRLLVYYDYLNASRFEQMQKIQRSLDELASVERAFATEEQRLHELLVKQEDEKRQLEAAREERARIIAALNLRLQSKEQELAGLQASEQQLQKLLDELQSALADIALDPAVDHPFVTRKGQLPWPAKGRIAASYGATREVGKLRWDGVLIEAPEGEVVRSVHHGRVAFADWLRGFGLLLIIDHGDGYMSLYGYNQSLFKETGEWVQAGEVIAQVGSSGGRSTSGVYFEIRHNGTPIDPKKWCKKTQGRRISTVPGVHRLQRRDGARLTA